MMMKHIFQSPAKRRSTRRQHQEDLALQARMARLAAEQQHRELIWQADDYIKAFLREQWDEHFSSIVIECPLTIDELYELGDLPRQEGTNQCRRLVRVPVINEKVGISLWERLREEAQARQAEKEPQDQGQQQLTATPSRSRFLPRRLSELSIRRTKTEQQHKEDYSITAEKEAPRKGSTCAWCRDSASSFCTISSNLLTGTATEDTACGGTHPDAQDLREKRFKAFSWARKSSQAPSKPAEFEEPFWRREESTPLTTPLLREKHTVSEFTGRDSIMEKVLGKSNAKAVRKAIGSFGDSLAYGYGTWC